MSDTSGDTGDTGDTGAAEQPARDPDGRTTKKAPSRTGSRTASKTPSRTARKPAKKSARKPARSGAPRAQARKPADDRHDDHRDNGSDDGSDNANTSRNRNGNDNDDDRTGQDGQGRRERPKGTRLAVLAAEQLVGLTGKEFEGIVGLSRSDDGWSVSVELLEMRRIPSTTDVIAVYEVDVDQDGDLTGYRRLHRFLRGEAGEDR